MLRGRHFPVREDSTAIEAMAEHLSAVRASTLNGWKDIAKFFGRGVRTVQRWERDLGLPVYRIRNSEQSPVFSYTGELRLWLEARSAEGKPGAEVPRREAARQHNFHRARVAAIRSQELTLQLAQRIADQSRRTQALSQNLKKALAALPGRKKLGVAPEAEKMFFPNA